MSQQPTSERGVWVGDADTDGTAPFWIIASGGKVLEEGRIRLDLFDDEESRAKWAFLKRHDAALRLTA